MNTSRLHLTQVLPWVLAAALQPIGSVPLHAQPAKVAEITGIELRREGNALQVHFLLTGRTQAEVVENVARGVLVVKFRRTRPALSDDRRELAFNDRQLLGVAFEEVDEDTTWAKLRLRVTALQVELLPKAPPNRVVLALRPAPPTPWAEVSAVRLGAYRGGGRLVIQLNRLPRYESRIEGDRFLLRLRDARPAQGLRAAGTARSLALGAIEREGEDTLLRLELREPGLQAAPQALTDPPRLVFTFQPGPAAVARAGPAAPPQPAATAPEPPPPPLGRRPEPLEELLNAEPNLAVKANYILAEREFRAGNFAQAAEIFMRVFNASPGRKLGIRALFRAADAQYEVLTAAGAPNFHEVIGNYQAAVRAAEAAAYDSDLIPRAFYQIGRSYQKMGFNFEANVHYEILEERYPENVPYTPDSHYYRGVALVDLNRLNEGIEAFRKFVALRGDQALEGPAFYHVGDALYQQKQYAEARHEFDAGRRISPEYAVDFPLLLFHMGETYYENADIESARAIYRTLLDRYPDRPFAKLVALRVGDMLRQEGKEQEALRDYERTLVGAPPEIRVRGKLRIADIHANRPIDDYGRALKLYDEVIDDPDTGTLLPQALLRKALTQTLHHQSADAILTFERLARDFPASPLVRPNIIDANIAENLKELVGSAFARRAYWDVAKVYTAYKDRYFPQFRFKFTLFQVAASYHRLGLYDDAIALYDQLTAEPAGALGPLIALRRAQAYIEKDNLGKAEEALLRFIQEHKDNPYRTDARLELGRMYFLGRRYNDALNAYRILVQEFERGQAPELNEAIADVSYRLGMVHKELGQAKDAGEAFKKAVENFHYPIEGAGVPDFVIAAQFFYGDALFDLGDDEGAVAAYEESIRRYPNHERAPWARYQIGLIYRRTGQEQKALEIFNGLVDLAKSRPGELWEALARENQKDLVNLLQYREYLKQ
ncbi:MAG: tetratricopeptide repeat protein [Candidatus Lambdaproteobacteria bacterium]|nr:tetratricopeptide repeat protein [Candidatus Lambdaproteobacteria bacterium]